MKAENLNSSMDYLKLHNNIVNRAKNRISKVSRLPGFELHHIRPRCLGGSDDKENLVLLTYKEHYLVHVLLAKLNPTHQGLNYAVVQMGGRSFINSRGYSIARDKHSKFLSEKNTGEGNPMFGRSGNLNPRYGVEVSKETRDKIAASKIGKKHSEEAKENMRKAQLGVSYGPCLKETKEKIRLKRQEFNIHTPKGVFVSSRLAAKELSVLKLQFLIDAETLQKSGKIIILRR